MTQKLRKNSSDSVRDLGAQVTELLARQLFSGEFQPGNLLPSEFELAETLSVSRASVRSGLQTLTALGIISRRAGRGTIVEESREWNLLDPRVSQWMADYAHPDSEFIRGIYEYRRAVEPYVSAMAATRATAQDLVAIESAYLDMKNSVADEHSDTFSRADIAYHSAIYRATHNLIWAQSAHILRPAIALVVEKSNSTAEELSDSLERHRLVMECIRLRQPEAAFDAAISVLDRTAEDLGVTTSSADDVLVGLIRNKMISSRS